MDQLLPTNQINQILMSTIFIISGYSNLKKYDFH